MKGSPTDDYPWAPTEDDWRRILSDVAERWGQRDFFEELVAITAPAMVGDQGFLDWFVTHMRRSLSPGAAAAFYRMMMEADVADVLSAVRVPTLVLFSPAERAPAEYSARHIPNTQIVELPQMRGSFTWLDEDSHRGTMRATGEFAARLARKAEPDRVLATVLIRAGVHTGECEVIDGKYGGLAVSIGARILSLAGLSEVVVSSTVKDLVAGSGLTFEDAGEHELKGVPDRWHLYRVTG